MSDHPGVCCDRCGLTTLKVKASLGTWTIPDGWGLAHLSRTEPYLSTGTMDLCPDCVTHVYDLIMRPP